MLCTEQDLPEGHVIYQPGQFAEELYVLVSGIVEISYGRRASSMQLSVQYGRHEIFGWASLLPRKGQRIATAKLSVRSTVLEISGSKLVATMERDFDMGFAILREFNSQISNEIRALAAG